MQQGHEDTRHASAVQATPSGGKPSVVYGEVKGAVDRPDLKQPRLLLLGPKLRSTALAPVRALRLASRPSRQWP